MNNLFLLWRQILRDPMSLGTVAPSSSYLARCVVAAAGLNEHKYVVEVGAGTGPLTHFIYPKVDPRNFAILEPNAEMVEQLQHQFQHAQVHQQKVQDLEVVVTELNWPQVDIVISSLPWSIFPQEVLQDGLKAMHTVMSPDAKLLTLVYSHAQYFPSSRYLEGQFLQYFENVYRTRTTWRNVPPGYFLVGERPRQIKLSEQKKK